MDQRFRRGFTAAEKTALSGSKNSYIATLVERRTRYVMLVKIPGQSEQQSEAAMRGAWRLLGMTRAGSGMCMTSSLKLLRQIYLLLPASF
jgi:IS30 family transposase